MISVMKTRRLKLGLEARLAIFSEPRSASACMVGLIMFESLSCSFFIK